MPLLLWLINGLLALVTVLIGFIVKLHMASDEEHRKAVDDEILRMRNRLHDLTGKMMEIDFANRHKEKA